MRPRRHLLALALACACGPARAEGPSIHRASGSEASRFSSAYWFLTERGSVLVDAPFLASEASVLKAEMTAAGASPLGAAILTAGRPERSWGLGVLASPATRVWGARSTAAELEATFHAERERLLRAGIPLSAMPRTAPRVTNSFQGSLNLGFEGYTLRLFEVGEAGRRPRTVVFVPETGALFAGDLVWNHVHPVTGGADLGAWRRALGDLRRLRPVVVYPGQGEPGGPELLDQMSAYLGALEEAIRPLAYRSALTARDVASARRAFVRRHRDWLLPSALDESLRAEHARLRGLLAGGD